MANSTRPMSDKTCMVTGATSGIGQVTARALAQQGTQTSIHLAASPDVEGITGSYFVDKKAVPSSPASYDATAAGRLWRVSAEMTGLPTSV